MLWTLWNRRNNLRLGKPALSLGQVVEFAQDRILEKNPCNIDGAVFADEGLAGLGVVIRNDHGLIMASLT